MGNRTVNATRNAFFAIILKVYQIAVPFIVRTIFIYKLGMNYLGLNSLFTSILGVLNLAELGVGSALVFSMYKPVAEHDTDSICALMNYYKKCYRVIGTVILIAGLALMPFISYFIKSDIPDGINIYVLYCIQLASTLSTYFLFAYKNCLFNAHQRNDITSKISLISNTVIYIFQIAILLTVADYYLYIIVVPVINVISNIATACIASRYYPEYVCRGKVEDQQLKIINKKIRALFTLKIGNIVLNSVDTIVISSFLGLIILGQYNSYYYVVSSVLTMVGLLTSSIVSTLGNSLVMESNEKNYHDFQRLAFLNFWLVGWCSVCLICLYQHFMQLWVGKSNMLPTGIVILFTCYFYTMQSNQVAGAYKDAGGIWTEDQFRPLVTAGVNLVTNIILVQIIGLYGIVLSTVISLLFVNTPWLIYNVHKLVFQKSSLYYYREWLINLAVTLVATAITYALCCILPETGILILIVKMGICIVIPNVVFWICYRRTSAFEVSKQMVIGIFKSVMHRK